MGTNGIPSNVRIPAPPQVRPDQIRQAPRPTEGQLMDTAEEAGLGTVSTGGQISPSGISFPPSDIIRGSVTQGPNGTEGEIFGKTYFNRDGETPLFVGAGAQVDGEGRSSGNLTFGAQLSSNDAARNPNNERFEVYGFLNQSPGTDISATNVRLTPFGRQTAELSSGNNVLLRQDTGWRQTGESSTHQEDRRIEQGDNTTSLGIGATYGNGSYATDFRAHRENNTDMYVRDLADDTAVFANGNAFWNPESGSVGASVEASAYHPLNPEARFTNDSVAWFAGAEGDAIVSSGTLPNDQNFMGQITPGIRAELGDAYGQLGYSVGTEGHGPRVQFGLRF